MPRRLVFTMALVASAASLALFWAQDTDAPRTLFEQRCSGCHVLPDLTGYGRHYIVALVDRMRSHYNVESAISDEEAEMIATYLQSTALSADQAITNESIAANSLPMARVPSDFFVVDVVADGLDFPASINFAPNGSLYILERGNLDEYSDSRHPPRLKRFDLSTGTMQSIGVIENGDVVPAPSETINAGALGLELDPGFAENGRLYICYHHLTDPTDDRSGLNRLSSFRIVDDKLIDERILIDQLSASAVHNGCRVVIGPEGYLYYATGEGNENAQNLSLLSGKILRIRTDGSIPSDNPFPGSPIWSYGHRNPQGLAFDPTTGRLWSTEHGSDTDDELNLIEGGKNYGWPHCVGEVQYGQLWGSAWSRERRFLKARSTISEARNTTLNYESLRWSLKQIWAGRNACYGADYRPAVKSFYPSATIGISDMVFYTSNAFSAWRGSLFFVTLKTASLIRLELEGASVKAAEVVIDHNDPANYGRLRDVTVGPNGYLYVVTNVTNPSRVANVRPKNPRGGMLLRLRPTTSLGH